MTQSYSEIAKRLSAEPAKTCFVSDVVEELDAARAAGFMTVLCMRPGNSPVTRPHTHTAVKSFDELP